MDLLISFINNGIIPLFIIIIVVSLEMLNKFKKDDTISKTNITYLKTIVFFIISLCFSNIAIVYFMLKKI